MRKSLTFLTCGKSLTFLKRSCAKTTCTGHVKKRTTFHDSLDDPRMEIPIPICEPWCWYIYLQNWVILFGKMLVNIPAPWSIWDL